MSEAKTRPTEQSVDEFLDAIPDERRRQDCRAVAALMSEVTGAAPQMWGASIVGFGSYHYRYASGREGDWMLTGFSPRKDSLTVYLSYGLEQQADLLERLGKHKIGKACLYIKRLEDIDPGVLRELVARSVEETKRANAMP
jgi:nucleoid DNA-binding protein